MLEDSKFQIKKYRNEWTPCICVGGVSPWPTARSDKAAPRCASSIWDPSKVSCRGKRLWALPLRENSIAFQEKSEKSLRHPLAAAAPPVPLTSRGRHSSARQSREPLAFPRIFISEENGVGKTWVGFRGFSETAWRGRAVTDCLVGWTRFQAENFQAFPPKCKIEALS